MKDYKPVEIEIIYFDEEDIICTSGGLPDDGDEEDG